MHKFTFRNIKRHKVILTPQSNIIKICKTLTLCKLLIVRYNTVSSAYWRREEETILGKSATYKLKRIGPMMDP